MVILNIAYAALPFWMKTFCYDIMTIKKTDIGLAGLD